MKINKDKIRVGIHSEPNHADDVLCVALLQREYGKDNVSVLRTREIDKLKTCDYILDVGGKDEIVKNADGEIVQGWLDHHQKDSGYEENGVKKAACSKLVDFLYEDEQIRKELHKILIDPVAVDDNGQDLQVGKNLLNFVGYVIEQDWTLPPSKAKSEQCFQTALNIVFEILNKVLERILNRDFGTNLILSALDTKKDYIVLEQYVPRSIWNGMLIKYNKEHEKKIKAVVFPSTHSNWDAIMVHKRLDSFECLQNFPENWCGLRDEELEQESGIKGAVFCHTAGFFWESTTKESAILAVEKVLGMNNAN